MWSQENCPEDSWTLPAFRFDNHRARLASELAQMGASGSLASGLGSEKAKAQPQLWEFPKFATDASHKSSCASPFNPFQMGLI